MDTCPTGVGSVGAVPVACTCIYLPNGEVDFGWLSACQPVSLLPVSHSRIVALWLYHEPGTAQDTLLW